MNGVRRFLGAATSSQSQPAPPEPPVQTAPLVIPAKGPSWPPPEAQSPSVPSPRSISSTNTTAALFLRKDRDRQKAQAQTLEDEAGNTSRVSTSSSRSQPASNTSSPNRPPLPGPNTSASIHASPRISPSNALSRQSTSQEWKRSSGMLNTRDELLISLLASEAVVDSRGFDIFSSEEVEELKKEQQVLSSRVAAMTKKLSLEMKIRDAAVSLSKVNASHKKMSKQTEEQLEAANRRVDAAQKELWRVSERSNEVHRKLMEHRAAVLSLSVRSMEKKMAPTPSSPLNGSTEPSDSGYGTPGRSTPLSPSSLTSISTQSNAKFDGAHLFAGHADAVIPRRRRSLSSAANEITTLEEKLKAATESLNAASRKQAEMSRELSILKLEKQEVETRMGMELQGAEDTIMALERELPKLEDLDAQVTELLEEKEGWERERAELVERAGEAEALRNRVRELEARSGKADSSEKVLAEESRRRLEEKDAAIQQMRIEWDSERGGWERDRAALEDEKMEELSRLQEEMDRVREEDKLALEKMDQELDNGLSVLQNLVQKHGIVLFARGSSFISLLESVGIHLDGLKKRIGEQERAKEEWDGLKKKLEDDVRAGLDKREALVKDVEEARKEREDARREIRSLEARLKAQEQAMGSHVPITPTSTSPMDYTGEAARIVAILQPIWAVLPSPEQRAAKYSSQRQYRTGSPTPSSPSGGPTASLSDLDVRSLKTLYDPNTNNPNTNRSIVSSPGTSNFTVEGFASRVQALIADDRALIERLIRFAQAHDLLKKNAERAQKLAQESNLALETYQKQVKTLDDRNLALATQNGMLQEEVQKLQDAVDRITVEKLEVETQAAEQAETCRQLTEANNTLSARTLNLAEEAASAPEKIKRQLEAQLAECKASLQAAQDEVDAMRSSEQSQRIALLDELNTMQTENSNLRAQLRAAKRS